MACAHLRRPARRAGGATNGTSGSRIVDRTRLGIVLGNNSEGAEWRIRLDDGRVTTTNVVFDETSSVRPGLESSRCWSHRKSSRRPNPVRHDVSSSYYVTFLNDAADHAWSRLVSPRDRCSAEHADATERIHCLSLPALAMYLNANDNAIMIPGRRNIHLHFVAVIQSEGAVVVVASSLASGPSQGRRSGRMTRGEPTRRIEPPQ